MASPSNAPVLISLDMLPTEETVFFEDSSFFKNHSLSDIPTVDQIAAAALPGCFRFVSIFPTLSLAVKRIRTTNVHRASAAEGQTMWALRKFLPEVRVPEVYGWRREGDDLFVFMELIDGVPLHERWRDLTEEQRTQVCIELDTMVRNLRRLVRPPEEEFIGAIGGQPSMDALCFGNISNAFPNSTAFYEFVLRKPSSEWESAFERGHLPLPFDSPIVFTHSDLHFSNVMVTRGNEPLRILAIIDWQQSGWMPRFWEYSKQMFMQHWSDDTDKMFATQIEISGDVPQDVFMAFATHMQAHGGLI